MKTSLYSALALALCAHAAHAQQSQPLPPVAETQTTEDAIISQNAQTPEPPALVGTAAAPTSADQTKWDVNNPRGLTLREVAIDTDEGTWMNVDVSPDGRTIAFDMLGDIYTMPITGGAPTRIADGLAYEHQPRFSPDGRRIAFTSDRGGGDNIWVMNVDGSDKRQVTKEDFRLLNQPTWSPDGRFIAAKKHFTTGRSLGTGEVWLYHVSGGAGVPLVKRASEVLQKELGEPIYAPDGNAIYYVRNTSSGPIFEYAQNSRSGIFDIERYDLNTGTVTTAVSGAGGAVRPTPSPDGRALAFVRRDNNVTSLYVKDLATGAERKIFAPLDRDVQETWAVTGVYPNIAWTPDNRSLVFWAGGKLNRVNADGRAHSVIPFQVRDTRVVADATHPAVEVAPDTITTQMPRWASVSPDGRTVVFESLGKLYTKPAAGGEARRLVTNSGDAMEAWPSWSRDGRSVVFVSWTDAGLGVVKTVPARGGNATAVTQTPGHYANPRLSPDGRTIAFEQREGGYLTAARGGGNPGIYLVDANGSNQRRLPVSGTNPQWGEGSGRLFFIGSDAGKARLVSTDLAGGNERVHATGELVNDFSVSPDGRFLAFRQNYQAFVTPLMPGTQDVALSPDSTALPVTRVSDDGADFINWSSNGQRLHWSLGPTLYTAAVEQLFPSAPAPAGAAAPKFIPPTTGNSLAMTLPADKPRGDVLLTGARIITMSGADGGVIEVGDILIQGDRIVALGASGTLTVPAGATRVDVGGKTIMPGIIDGHAHGPQGADDLIPQQNWSAIANLALGTTTIHDPSSSAREIFPAAEMQRAGTILAPRIFSTGEIIYGAKAARVYAEIDSYEDALDSVRRLKAQGARSVKNYNQPRRDQRQMVTAAAQAENMLVVPEGGSLWTMDVSLIQDGNSTIEHNVPGEVFYDDLLDLWTQTKVAYNPTLVVAYGGLAGDPYWRQHTNVWEHPILRRHEPTALLLANNVRRSMAPEEDYIDDEAAREALKLARRGVDVAIGGHGQQAGLAAHWEIWSLARGGATPVEALAAATIMPARAYGYDRDIGSLEVGKLADLVVLDANPLENIRDTDKVHRVMLGGRLYDPLTMNEVTTGDRRRAPYWWETEGSGDGAGARMTRGHGH
ncbi:amidohydrolase family protein [Porphyrobacter sp. GA68]|uniref:amidohydrolase family protein n=1 Tax=Porphyrobacter sp. GA68 TaxID=2883480 RepID=UPI001D196443|nr:amidohydrolase family protein [Porphyrobacter sp. GA68]